MIASLTIDKEAKAFLTRFSTDASLKKLLYPPPFQQRQITHILSSRFDLKRESEQLVKLIQTEVRSLMAKISQVEQRRAA